MSACQSCGHPKAPYVCELCQGPTCKDCRRVLDARAFSFYAKVPAALKPGVHCAKCHDEKLVPEIAKYDELMAKAEEVYFLTRNYRGNVRIFRQHTRRVAIDDCDDRRECILRMAFKAVELGFNAIILAEVESKKLRKNHRQTTRWSGSAMPALIDGAHLEIASLRGF